MVKTLDVAPSPPMGTQLATNPPVEGEEWLEPGDMVLLYTDGLTEARRPNGELFTVERLAKFIERKPPTGCPLPKRCADCAKRSSKAVKGPCATTPPRCSSSGAAASKASCPKPSDSAGSQLAAGRKSLRAAREAPTRDVLSAEGVADRRARSVPAVQRPPTGPGLRNALIGHEIVILGEPQRDVRRAA
jgi:hypothetical protein